MRAYAFISSCHCGDSIVAVIDSHMFVVTSSNVSDDVRHSFVIMCDTASSTIILHTSVFMLLAWAWLVEGSGLSGWLVGRSGIRTEPPSGVSTTVESGKTYNVGGAVSSSSSPSSSVSAEVTRG